MVTDADYAGCKNTRKSISCRHIFLDGNLLESKVSSQKSIALSSGKSEFVAIVGGCSEAMFIRHLWWHFMFGQFLRVKSRSDSSAARSMCQRQGAGRVRHLDAGMFWIQQRIQQKVIETSPILTLVNSADLGTKSLSKARTAGLMHVLGMVDEKDEPIGLEEFEELEGKVRMSKKVKQINTCKVKDVMMAMMFMINLIKGESSTTEETKESKVPWFEILVSGFMVMVWALGLAMGICMCWWTRRSSTSSDVQQLEETRAEMVDVNEMYFREQGVSERLRDLCKVKTEQNSALQKELKDKNLEIKVLQEEIEDLRKLREIPPDVKDLQHELLKEQGLVDRFKQQVQVKDDLNRTQEEVIEEYEKEIKALKYDNAIWSQKFNNLQREVNVVNTSKIRRELERLRASSLIGGEVFHLVPGCQHSSTQGRRMCKVCLNAWEGSMTESSMSSTNSPMA